MIAIYNTAYNKKKINYDNEPFSYYIYIIFHFFCFVNKLTTFK
ncbi:hypothetical protein CNEO4_1370038 [Clostridium neonatale]|uniref:Uncharacterized protein n=1 Tax=Clostridium neonatale TaxID=137838 RepID=A0AA86JJ01_9CLOT|nr:hypothetical protein CNEO_44000 [Clostridium neonatale]CAI3199948.1 hypothetical protein CNEO2_1870001 [Clostridium neonatale]CAI3204504.1 hypothetical protein CNEO2_310033 [Clostridium neonatale]CAI3239745.1 hypothetical protein CNEO2_340001 [Clostridium neonatale]CAI3243759.1 hypothetical protein CNEO2_500031 [Clostridium neonatale]